MSASSSKKWRSGKRAAAALGIATLAAGGLAGCDYARPAEFSVQRSGSAVVISACEDVEMSRVTVAIGNVVGRATTRVWSIEGEHDARRGETFVLFGPVEGMTEIIQDKDQLDSWSSLTLYIYGEPDGASTYDMSSAASDSWVRWDGSVGDTPCL